MFIYQLEHHYWKGDYDPSGFRIGYYSSLEKALTVRKEYLTLPGFCDHPEGFQILRHIVNASSCDKIWIADLAFDEYCDEYISLGVFESKEAAEKAVEYYKSTRGNEVQQGQFMIWDYTVNDSGWETGFFTYYYTEEE